MSEIERNKEVARQFIENMSNNNVAAIIESYDDDVKIYTMGNTLISGVVNKTQAREFAGQVLGAFPQGIRFEVHNLTAEGDRVAIEAEGRAELKNGRIYANRYHYLFVFRDGKICRAKLYNDTKHAAEIQG